MIFRRQFPRTYVESEMVHSSNLLQYIACACRSRAINAPCRRRCYSCCSCCCWSCCCCRCTVQVSVVKLLLYSCYSCILCLSLTCLSACLPACLPACLLANTTACLPSRLEAKARESLTPSASSHSLVDQMQELVVHLGKNTSCPFRGSRQTSGKRASSERKNEQTATICCSPPASSSPSGRFIVP